MAEVDMSVTDTEASAGNRQMIDAIAAGFRCNAASQKLNSTVPFQCWNAVGSHLWLLSRSAERVIANAEDKRRRGGVR